LRLIAVAIADLVVRSPVGWVECDRSLGAWDCDRFLGLVSAIGFWGWSAIACRWTAIFCHWGGRRSSVGGVEGDRFLGMGWWCSLNEIK
jgi:hypothetical protein